VTVNNGSRLGIDRIGQLSANLRHSLHRIARSRAVIRPKNATRLCICDSKHHGVPA
jgi:hypothetical protein